MQRIAQALHQSGWDVQLIGRLRKKSQPLRNWSFKTQRVNLLFEKGFAFYLSLNLIFFIKAMISRSKILWSVDLDTLPALRIAAFFRSKKLIWDCHEIYPFMPELYQKPFKQKIWIAIEKIFVPGLKQVLTVTHGVSQYLRQEYQVDPTIIHNYPYFRPSEVAIEEKLNSKTLLFQGALNEGRGLEVMILAVNKIKQEINLIIAGDGPLKSSMQALCTTLGLDLRIRFTGELNPDALKLLTDQSMIGISLLNKEHRNSWISLANKNLDYIMACVPCITVNFPEYAAINQRWPVAILLDETTVETVSDAVNNLMDQPPLYQSLYENCKQARQVLNWETEVKRFNQFIENLNI